MGPSTNPPPSNAETIGEGSTTIIVESASSNSATIRFARPPYTGDDQDLLYSVYVETTGPIETIEQARTLTPRVHGNERQIAIGADAGDIVVNLTDLVPLQRYYLNIIVETVHTRAIIFETTSFETPGEGSTSARVTAGSSAVFMELNAGAPVGDESIEFNVQLDSQKNVYAIYYNLLNDTIPPNAGVEPLQGLSQKATEPPPPSFLTEIAEDNARLQSLAASLPRSNRMESRLESSVPGVGEAIGDTEGFHVRNNEDVWRIIPSTLRYVSTAHDRKVQVWVADDSWHDGGSSINRITEAMASTLGSTFLRSGIDNDIYEWVTALVGAEWGEDVNTRFFIPFTKTIDILLYDIFDDKEQNSGVLGYYWGKDVFQSHTQDGVNRSNRRHMFAIDAVFYGSKYGSSWDSTDPGPALIHSTLAHEFQHMIHFYQRAIATRYDSEVQYNEMMSMMVEDLVAAKQGVIGPRGVDPTDPSGGPSGNYRGRIPYLNNYPDTQANTWLRTGDTFRSYSLWYGMGAYLLRTCGGAPLMRELMLSPHGETPDAIKAVAASHGFTNFSESYAGYMAALILSNKTDAPNRYRINSGNWFESQTNGIDFRIGSIDAYRYTKNLGPKVYSSGSLPSTFNKDTAYMVDIGTYAPGEWEISVPLPAHGSYNGGQTVAIVVKDAS